MLQVAHLTLSATTAGGGISEAVRALATSQVSLIEKVSVVAAADGGDPLSPWPAGSPHQLASRQLPGIRYVPGLGGLLGGLDPDIVHLHGLWSWFSVEAPRWSRRVSRPYLVSPHGMLDAWALGNAAWKKYLAAAAFERRNLKGASCLHALCKPESDAIRAYGLRNPIAIIPNGIDLPEDHDQGTGDRDQESGKKILLFLGRLHPKKGLINAIRAWHTLSHSKFKIQNSKFAQWQFIIAGWDQGGHEAELKQLCDELGLTWTDTPAASFLSENCKLNTENSQIVFTGPAFGETKDELLRRAAAFILPSFSEGLPMSVLEAWAYRLPVVMTDHCNLPEGFASGAALRIGTDVESIAEGMRLLFRSPTSDLRSLGSNGRALVERQFTWQRVAEQMKETYEWVLGGGEPPAHHQR